MLDLYFDFLYMKQSYHISGYSTALFATWYLVEEWGILFDAGDGLCAALLGKARKIKHVFVSHADRDHVTGLLQLNQLTARKDFPKVYYPKDCGSFPALEAFSKRFDTHVQQTQWTPIEAGQEISIKKELRVRAIRNGHVQTAPSLSKSLSFHVLQSRKKLKSEYRMLSGEEIQGLMKERGKENLTEEITTTLLSYSGDTPVEDWDRWADTQILIHEATFLGGKEDKPIVPHGNLHSTLEEVMEMVAASTIQTLILGHFSSRYSAEHIDTRIKNLCDSHAITIPVFRLLPGQATLNILTQSPINQ